MRLDGKEDGKADAKEVNEDEEVSINVLIKNRALLHYKRGDQTSRLRLLQKASLLH
jgi:hypothetical protein